jgi:flagellar hook-associated protein 1 FlgK
MSLFGSIQLGANTLQAMQIGLQVTGNNIANANTPGYIRQEVIYAPAPVQRIGNLVLGLGVQVEGIVDKIDKFVLDRLVGARGDRAGAEIQEDTYHEIEVLLNGLSGTVDLGTSLNSFFNSIGEVLSDPTSPAARNLVIGQGESLTRTINNVSSRVLNIRVDLNDQIAATADEINTLSEQVRRLNVQIATVEGGGSSSSDAGGLRVQRQAAIDRLSELVGITVNEQQSGAVNVSVGGEFLVFEGQRRAVQVNLTNGDGIALATVQFSDTQSALNTTAGELNGLYVARDTIVGDFLDGLNELASLLAFEFNKIYSQGQGLVGFSQLTSVNSIADADAALDEAGLDFTPVNGTFQVLVHNKAQHITKTHDVLVDLNGIDDDTSLNDLTATLDAIDGISASVTAAGKLQIRADSADTDFAFAGDTSGLLAALGINTFFTGSTALDIGVNAELKGIGNEAKFAASLGGFDREVDAENAERLFAFLETPLDAVGGNTLPDVYERLINTIGQGATIAKSVAEGYRVFEGTLDGQLLAVGGVNLDEEAIQLITLQRIYQASARFIQVAAELLDVLVNL